MFATYPAGTPCADVLVDTPIAQVPPACAAQWSPLHVGVVPGQALLKRAPGFPPLTSGPGVTQDEAIQYGGGFWRTEAFQGFSVATRQLSVASALGKDELLVRFGVLEQAVLQGDTVTTPLCHFFPTALRVVVLAPDMQQFVHGQGRTLGLQARFNGPCYADATDAHGNTKRLFSFTGAEEVVFVGEPRTAAPFGASLWLTGLAECTKDVAKKTCAE